jgi:hypothetical protein
VSLPLCLSVCVPVPPIFVPVPVRLSPCPLVPCPICLHPCPWLLCPFPCSCPCCVCVHEWICHACFQRTSLATDNFQCLFIAEKSMDNFSVTFVANKQLSALITPGRPATDNFQRLVRPIQ